MRKAVPNISQSLQREVMPVQKIIDTHYSMCEQSYGERGTYIFFTQGAFSPDAWKPVAYFIYFL